MWFYLQDAMLTFSLVSHGHFMVTRLIMTFFDYIGPFSFHKNTENSGNACFFLHSPSETVIA